VADIGVEQTLEGHETAVGEPPASGSGEDETAA
jgi:hypothetical protein